MTEMCIPCIAMALWLAFAVLLLAWPGIRWLARRLSSCSGTGAHSRCHRDAPCLVRELEHTMPRARARSRS